MLNLYSVVTGDTVPPSRSRGLFGGGEPGQKELTLHLDWGNHSEGLWFILMCVSFPGKLPLFWKL